MSGSASGHSFRKDIEGLRAICITSVVLYHVAFPGFSGGFFGVDIFFVISGFLISGLLIDEARATGRIDLLRFWAKRARRLLPNATLTLIATLLIAAVLFPAHNREVLAKDAAAAALYVSNYRFAENAVDYFSADNPLSPVMHFWSLSIEEQFYIVWPVLFFSFLRIWTAPRAVATLLLGLTCVLSFAACLVLVHENQPLAFFHTETRCWQLAVGGLVACWLRLRQPLHPTIGWLGIALIIASIGGLDDTITHPGVLSLIPTLGAAGVLIARPAQGWTSPAPVLSLSPFQWLGARSYSWYLWHWPAIIFAQALFPDPPAALLSVPVSLAIASVVFRYLEDPIRRNDMWSTSVRRSLAGGGVAIAGVLASSVAFSYVANFSGSASKTYIAALKAARKDLGQNYADACHLHYDDTAQADCVYGDPSGSRRVVLFGDSHAAQWFAPINAAAKEAGWAFNAWTKTSCPSADFTVWNQQRKAAYSACDQWRKDILGRLTGAQRPDLVLISNMENYSGLILDRQSGEVLRGRDADQVWLQGLRSVLDQLTRAGVRVVIIRDTPRAFKSFSKCLASGGEARCDKPRAQALEQNGEVQRTADDYGGQVETLDLTDRICDAITCPTVKHNMFVYLDHHHLNATFSATLHDEFYALLRRH